MFENISCPDFTWPNGYKSALTFSFDDGRLSQIQNGLPLFDKLGVRATFYVMPERVVKRPDDWKRALAAGHEIGNHTVTHPCSAHFAFARKKAKTLDDMTLDDIEKEILEANEIIEKAVGITPQTFAHPCGQKYVGRGIDLKSYVPIVAENFIVGRGFKDESHNSPVYGDISQAMGVDSDNLGYDHLQKMLKRSNDDNGWLFLAGHDIGQKSIQTTDAEVIASLVEYCNYNNIWVDTAENIGRHILSQRK